MPSLRCVGIPVVSLLFAIRKHQTLLMAQTHSASLISITPKAEDQIAYCARVSNPKNQENYDTAPRLLRYCIANNHWSPFEMANMVVVITTTRSIAAQILRHRSFSFQEFSQRYADASVLGNAGVPELRFQDTKNRQNSITDDHGNLSSTYGVRLQTHMAMAQALYQDMLDGGVAKECAREVLPLATPTTLFMNGTIRSWLHYVSLRSGNGTQKEHRMIADDVRKIMQEQLPSVAFAMWPQLQWQEEQG
jgi:thymidylate synthase (FAD)